MPIRLRLTLLATAGSLLFCVAGGLVFVHMLAASLRDATDTTLRTTADGIIQNLQTSPSSTDLRDPVTTGLVNSQQTVSQIIAPNGTISDASDSAASTPIISTAELHNARSQTITMDGHLTAPRENVRILATPVVRNGGTWVVVVATSLAPNTTALDRVTVGLLIGGATLLLLAASGAWLLSTAALRPVERMRRHAAALASISGGRDAHLDVPATRDELRGWAAPSTIYSAP